MTKKILIRNGEIEMKDTHEEVADRTIDLYGRKIKLTKKEYAILKYLAMNKGRVVEKAELFEEVWGEKYMDDSNTVTVHVWNLRIKLEDDPRNPEYIKTSWGIGYLVE